MKVGIKRLPHATDLPLPHYATQGSAGLDLLAAVNLAPEEFFVLKNDPRLDAVVHQVALRARDHWLAARRGPRPGPALAALLPAALVPLYLRSLGNGKDVPIHRRQMALLGAAMRRKL